MQTWRATHEEQASDRRRGEQVEQRSTDRGALAQKAQRQHGLLDDRLDVDESGSEQREGEQAAVHCRVREGQARGREQREAKEQREQTRDEKEGAK